VKGEKRLRQVVHVGDLGLVQEDDVQEFTDDDSDSDESLPDEGVLEVCKDFYAKAGEAIVDEEEEEECALYL
jgi:hypothetical protein